MARPKRLLLHSFMVFWLVVWGSVSASVAGPDSTAFNASPDYIKDCKYATCVGMAGSEWSENNPFGVAVSVRMGTQPAVTDSQIKMVLTSDFAHYGVTNVKFFYEQNDVPASVIRLHVRGGTEGPFIISNVRQEIELIAQRAKNKNPAMITSQ